MAAERDFLGLGVNHHHHHHHHHLPPPVTPPSGSLKSSTAAWPFPNNAPTLPHLLSFQGENANTGFGSLTSNGLIAIRTDAFFGSDMDGGEAWYGSTTYPTNQFDSRAIHHTVTTKTRLKIEPSGVHRSFVDASGPNLSLSSQPHTGVPFANPATTIPIAGTTDSRNGTKIPGASTELTIFYNGSVCVYENISPDKAQAIMLLAGNGPSARSTKPSPMPKPPIFDQSYTATELNIAQPAASSNTVAAKPSGGFMSSSVIAKPLKTTTMSTGSSSSAKFISSETVPQFRKKSLARFLEKRKERVISASPYGDKEATG